MQCKGGARLCTYDNGVYNCLPLAARKLRAVRRGHALHAVDMNVLAAVAPVCFSQV